MEIQRIVARMASAYPLDALDLLERDHAAVGALFEAYDELESDDDKEALVARIIVELVIHARIERELFYPALRQAIGNEEMMKAVDADRTMLKVMADLNALRAHAPQYDAMVNALGDLFLRHVREEEGGLFSGARESGLDLSAIGAQLDAYRAALRSRYELDAGGVELSGYLAAPTPLPAARDARSERARERTILRVRPDASTRPNGRSATERRSGTVAAPRRTHRASRAPARNS
jgi:Hemerythrin HHE cation binding domain